VDEKGEVTAMNRRSFLKILGIGALSQVYPAVLWSEKVKKTNVLFIAIDDLRGTVGCLGDKIAVTPNMSGLSKSLVSFSRMAGKRRCLKGDKW
jgi:hypothetical protein